MTPSPTSRRAVLGAAATSAAVVLAPVDLAAAEPGRSGTTTRTVTGHLDPGAADWVYLPVDVPRGVRRIAVSYAYDKPAQPAGTVTNSCDIGVFDQRGYAEGTSGFRGWSGGFRTEFFLAADDATPGYLPGPVGAGRWHVVLGPYQVCPEGLTYSVTVTLDHGRDHGRFRPDYPPQAVRGTGRGWYRGDCHLHTVHSDGKRTPSEVAAAARTAGLDFMVSTDHNTSSSHGHWGPLAGDDLLIVTGEEVTTRNGHVLALGLEPGRWIDWRYRAGEAGFGRAARRVHRDGGLVVPAHPYCAYVGCRWKFGYEHADAVEVWNGPWTLDDESAVDSWDAMLVDAARSRGRWLPALGNSDAHSEPQVVGLPQTVVRSRTLSTEAVLAGIAAGHSYLAESAQVTVALEASARGRTAGIGERLDARPADAVIVRTEVAGVPHGLVRVITDEGQLLQSVLPASGARTVEWRTTPQQAAYVRVEVRHPLPDGSPGNGNAVSPTIPLGPMAAMTNPVWLGRR